MRFDDEVAIVTGAGNGIGRAAAHELARRGARVVVNDFGGDPAAGRPDFATAVADEISAAGGQAIACTQTVATEDGGEQIVRAALDTWGRADIVAAVAGNMRPNWFVDTPLRDYEALLAVHLGGVVNVGRPAARWMSGAGGGRIVIVASSAGLFGGVGHANYAAAKAAQVGLLRVLAPELASKGIRVNGVLPWARGTRLGAQVATSAIWTERPSMPSFDPAFLAELTPERVAALIAALSHRDVPWSNQLFLGFGRYFSRAWWSVGEGWLSPHTASAEDIAAHWEEIATTEGSAEHDGDTVAYNALVQELMMGTAGES